jgi:hypothetical protein
MMRIMRVTLLLWGVKEGGVVEGGVAHGVDRRKKSVSHGRAAAKHHDDDRGAESERKNRQSCKEKKLIAALRGHQKGGSEATEHQ